ncbi:hypothetical protein [Rhodococcus jostii]|uniref:hypothetical protein n=1 Tax=Rhodococcus jostii TaxID=132919 RepID=UPI0036656CB6
MTELQRMQVALPDGLKNAAGQWPTGFQGWNQRLHLCDEESTAPAAEIFWVGVSRERTLMAGGKNEPRTRRLWVDIVVDGAGKLPKVEVVQ